VLEETEAAELLALEPQAFELEAPENTAEVIAQAGEPGPEAVAVQKSQVADLPAVEPQVVEHEAMKHTTKAIAQTGELAPEVVAVQRSQETTNDAVAEAQVEPEPEAVAPVAEATPAAVGKQQTDEGIREVQLSDEGSQIKASLAASAVAVQQPEEGSQVKEATTAAAALQQLDEGCQIKEISLAQATPVASANQQAEDAYQIKATPAVAGTQDKIQDVDDEPKQERELNEGGEKIDESQQLGTERTGKDAADKAEPVEQALQQHPEQQQEDWPQEQQQQQQQQRQPNSNSKPTSDFVHLLGVDANGTHDPQVFRMKRDQLLKRLANTYANFRGLGATAGEHLRMSTPGKDEVDPLATVSSLGLADGDWVTFALVTSSESVPAPGDSGAVPMPHATGTSPSVRKQLQQAKPQAKRQKQMPAPNGCGLEQPKQPLSGFMMWLGDNRELIVTASGSSHWSPALSKEAGQKWKSSSAAEKAPYEIRAAEARADYDQALAEYVAQGGIVKKRRQKDAMAAEQSKKQPKKEPMPKRPWGGAYGVFLTERREEIRQSLPEECKFGDVTRAASETWKALSEDEKKTYEDVYARNLDDYKRAMEEYRRRHCADPEVPPTPPGLMRSAAVTTGPAKGWKVQCWRGRRGGLKWLIIQPGRGGRSFNNFNELKGGVVDTEVYSQLHNAVRPGLLRRMNERDPTTEGCVETPGKRRPGQSSDDTPFKTRRVAPSAPVRPHHQSKVTVAPPLVAKPLADLDWSSMATQAFRPPSKGVTHCCSCLAHLVRHSRCAPSDGQLQPAEIHLRDFVMVGRGETCDVILGSSRTPQMLSRNHAAIKRDGNSFTLMDQGSMNGVLVNGETVQNRCTLQVGDIVTFGVETDTPEFDYVFEFLAR